MTKPDGIRALLFDLDGVLISTDQFHYAAWKRLADSIGVPFDEETNRRLRGVSREESLEILLSAAPDRYFSDEEKRTLTERKNEDYRRLLASLTPGDVDVGMKNALRELKQRGYLLAVASSSKNAALILRRTGLEPFFDAVVTGNDIARSKPDPEVFLKAAERLGVPLGACAVIEDADAGIAAANAAGMTAVGFGAGKNSPSARFGAENAAALLSLF